MIQLNLFEETALKSLSNAFIAKILAYKKVVYALANVEKMPSTAYNKKRRIALTKQSIQLQNDLLQFALNIATDDCSTYTGITQNHFTDWLCFNRSKIISRMYNATKEIDAEDERKKHIEKITLIDERIDVFLKEISESFSKRSGVTQNIVELDHTFRFLSKKSIRRQHKIALLTKYSGLMRQICNLDLIVLFEIDKPRFAMYKEKMQQLLKNDLAICTVNHRPLGR